MSAGSAVVWIEGRQAHVFHVDAIGFDAWTVEADGPDSFLDVMSALDGVARVLVVGPAKVRGLLVDYLHARAPALRVTASEMVEHPTAKQLAACLQSYFAEHDPPQKR